MHRQASPRRNGQDRTFSSSSSEYARMSVEVSLSTTNTSHGGSSARQLLPSNAQADNGPAPPHVDSTTPTSPSLSRAPSFLHHRNSINGAVTTAMQTVTQLQVLLHQFEEDGDWGNGRNNGNNNSNNNLDEDDGMQAEEKSLREAEELMRREMECVDRLMSPPAPPQLPAPSPEFDQTTTGPSVRKTATSTRTARNEEEEEEDGSTGPGEQRSGRSVESGTYLLPPPLPTPKMTNRKPTLASEGSPTGVADLLDHFGVTLDKRIECTTPPRTVHTVVPTVQDRERKRSEGSFRSLVSELTDHEANGSNNVGGVFPSSPPSSAAAAEAKSLQKIRKQSLDPDAANDDTLVATLAWLAFGQRHSYRTRAITTTVTAGEDGADEQTAMMRTRTIEGGLCVAAATAIATSVLLGSHLRTEGQFLAAMVLLPALATSLEVKLPHRLEETSIALGILLCGFVLERTLFAAS